MPFLKVKNILNFNAQNKLNRSHKIFEKNLHIYLLTSLNNAIYAIANLNVSILLNRFSYGKVGTCTRKSSNAELMLLHFSKSMKRKEKKRKLKVNITHFSQMLLKN